MTLPRRCRRPLCNALTRHRHGYCEGHKHLVPKVVDRTRPARESFLVAMPDGRRLTVKQFYASPEWKRARLAQLRRQPACACGCGKKATVVDHVTPIRSGGDPLDAKNHRSLAWNCHSRKTAREDGGFRGRTKEVV